MIAALYARKSNLQPGLAQEATSVQRQIDHGRAFAESKGWVVEPTFVFGDDGVSGAEFEKRPGLIRLLNALPKKGQPPTFQVLVVSEISRLGREQLETGYVLHQLAKAGVRVFTYLTGTEAKAETPTDKLLLNLGMFADEVERVRARQ